MHIHLRDGMADAHSALLHKTSDVEHFKCFYCDQSEAITAAHKGPASG